MESVVFEDSPIAQYLEGESPGERHRLLLLDLAKVMW